MRGTQRRAPVIRPRRNQSKRGGRSVRAPHYGIEFTDEAEQEVGRSVRPPSYGIDFADLAQPQHAVHGSSVAMLMHETANAECSCAESPIGMGEPRQTAPGGEEMNFTTGGSSKCNLRGASQVITNNNDEATRQCTQEHEEKHVSDRSACCETARAAYQADGADQPAIMRAWNGWIRTNRPWSECRAYGVSVRCAEGLLGQNNCGGDSPPAVCAEIQSYRDHVAERRTHYCDRAADSRTPCPDFS